MSSLIWGASSATQLLFTSIVKLRSVTPASASRLLAFSGS